MVGGGGETSASWDMDALDLRAELTAIVGSIKAKCLNPQNWKGKQKNVDYLSKLFKWKWVRIFKYKCDFHSKKCFPDAKNICWCLLEQNSLESFFTIYLCTAFIHMNPCQLSQHTSDHLGDAMISPACDNNSRKWRARQKTKWQIEKNLFEISVIYFFHI